MMEACELVSLISAISCYIGKNNTVEELEELSVIFSQLGDTLATIALSRERNEE